MTWLSFRRRAASRFLAARRRSVSVAPGAGSPAAADNPCVVVGGGIAGLATAGLLARDGHATVLLEKNDGLGGRAGRWSRDGFMFDTGPSWYLMPEVIDHWFALMGTSAAAELDLVPLEPAYRTWFEGHAKPVDVVTGRDRAIALFESMDAGSGARLGAYLDSAAETYRLAKAHFLYDDFASLRGLVHPAVVTRMARLGRLLLQPLASFVGSGFSDERQRQLLGYPAVFLGTTPFKAPAMYHLMSHLDLADGVLYPRGGFAALVDAMERVAREAGVRIVTGATVRNIETAPGPGGERVSAVVWTSAEGTAHRQDAGTVVAAADLHHVETELLPERLRTHPEKAWKRRDSGPSAVLVCLGVRGGLPEMAHHNLLFTADWRDNFGRIDAGRDLNPETSIYVCRPSATDRGVAPDGHENLFVLVPSPAETSWGAGGIDGGGSAKVEQVADSAIEQLAAWTGVEDLRERIVLRRTYGPGDFALNVNAWRGSALGAAHTLRQSAFLRPGIRSAKVSGLLYAGSSVRPGIGVPMCMISAELVLKAVRGDRTPGPLQEPAAAPSNAGGPA